MKDIDRRIAQAAPDMAAFIERIEPMLSEDYEDGWNAQDMRELHDWACRIISRIHPEIVPQ